MSEGSGVMWMIKSEYFSDWDIHGIYTDKAEADRAAELANLARDAGEDEYLIEEVAVLDGSMPRRAELILITGYPLEEGDESVEIPRGTRAAFEDAPILGVDYYTRNLRVFGEPEAARKAYAEHAARIKANAGRS